MAHRAIIVGRDVGWVGLGIFAGRRNTIVARGTVIYDTSMIEHCIRKGAGYVTDAAILSGRDVAVILPGPFWSTRRIITVTC